MAETKKPAFIINLPSAQVYVSDEDIDDIMDTAMMGCTYWCGSAEPVGEYLGQYASEQISKGGKLTFYPLEDYDELELDKEKFKAGLESWLKFLGDGYTRVILDNWIEPGEIDTEDADAILQFALLGDIVYG